MNIAVATRNGRANLGAANGRKPFDGLQVIEQVGVEVLNIAHRAAHHIIDEVLACCYVATGTAPLRLCGSRTSAHSAIFERLAGRALGSEMIIEKHKVAAEHGSCYASVVPLETAEGVVGWLQILSRSAPELTALDWIANVTRTECDHKSLFGDSRLHRSTQPLVVPAQNDGSERSKARSNSGPIVRELVRSAAEALDATVVLQSSDLIVMAGAGDVERVRLDPSVWQRERELVLRAAALGDFAVLPSKQGNPSRVMASIYGGSDLLGHLVVGKGELSAEARDVISHCVEILSWVLRVENDVATEHEQRRAALVADLMSGSDFESVNARATALGHDLSRQHCSFAFTVDSNVGHHRDAKLRKLAHIVRTECRKHANGGLAGLVDVVDHDVIAFIPADGLSPSCLAKQVLGAVNAAGLTAACGIGTNSTGPAGFAVAARHARRAVEILRHGGHWQTVSRYEDLGVFGLLFSASDQSRLEEFVQRWLGPLLHYDVDGGAELTKTVEQLLENSTMMEAAASLHIHISTLKYRYKRIQDLLHVDLHDPDTTFNLKLAVKIHRVLTRLTGTSNEPTDSETPKGRQRRA